mgnify:CR=1 FL=1
MLNSLRNSQSLQIYSTIMIPSNHGFDSKKLLQKSWLYNKNFDYLNQQGFDRLGN